MFQRTIFSEEHEAFRETVRRFTAEKVVPFHDQWEEDGQISREAWQQAAEAGILCPTIDEKYGGAGADFLFSTIVIEELAKAETQVVRIMMTSLMTGRMVIITNLISTSQQRKQRRITNTN